MGKLVALLVFVAVASFCFVHIAHTQRGNNDNANWINSLDTDNLDDAEIESLSVGDAHPGQELDKELSELSKQNQKREFEAAATKAKDGTLEWSYDEAADPVVRKGVPLSQENPSADQSSNNNNQGKFLSEPAEPIVRKGFPLKQENPSADQSSNDNNQGKSIEQINAEQAETIPVELKDGDEAVDPNAPEKDKRSSHRNMEYLWLSKMVPYQLHSSLSSLARSGILEAIARYENKTCLRFTTDLTNQTNWIVFKHVSGCWSYVGRLYYRRGGKESNFFKKPERYSQLHGTAYDFGGIMHYSKKAFSKNSKATVQAIENPDQKLGQRDGFSDLDLFEINALYQCKNEDGGMSLWSEWGPCLSSGEQFKRYRQRYCFDKNVTNCPGVNSYGIARESITVNCSQCKRDGHWGRWSSWTTCSVSCSQGTRSRSRTCSDPAPRCSGAACNGTNSNSGNCFNGRCNLGPHDCDFDAVDRPMCDWKHVSTNDYMRFRHITGSTPSFNTGPSGDASPGRNGLGGYIYAVCSVPSNYRYQLVKLESKQLPPVSNGMISFKYHMYGSYITYLRLSLKNTSGTTELWRKTGNQNNAWHSASVSYNSAINYTLLFETQIGGSYQCDTALDEIILNSTLINHCSPNPCQNGGSCTSSSSGYTCSCQAGYTGVNCETLINHCNPNPCQNSGSCTSSSSGYTCSCQAGYTGVTCETLINHCNPNPCKNGASCTSSSSGYTCSCQAGYTGVNCETLINHCNPNPCQNGGSCTSSSSGYTCSCQAGYTGVNCETLINHCNPNPCKNGGSCTNSTSGYTCYCPIDYTGTNCESKINRCLPNPCLNGGNCTNVPGGYRCTCSPDYTGKNCATKINRCLPNPCLNGGNCTNVPGGYHCTCSPGYTGKNCATKINRCLPNPCLNGGNCTNVPGGHHCTCSPDYTGKNCATEINRCLPNPCNNGGTCMKLPGDFRCVCPPGFHGKTCDVVAGKFVDLVSCDFECGFCSLQQHKGANDKLDWTRRSGRTPSFYTGPNADHTTLKDGFYAYTEVSWKTRLDNAILSSPDMTSDGKKRCLDFWYHMYGNGIGSFIVQVEVGGVKTDMFKRTQNQGKAWTQALVDIDVAAGKKFKIHFESIRGHSYKGDIAIDDIRLWQGACPKKPKHTASVLACLFERGFCMWNPIADDFGLWSDGRYGRGGHGGYKGDSSEMNADIELGANEQPYKADENALSSDKRGRGSRGRHGPRRALSGRQDDFLKYQSDSFFQKSKGSLFSPSFLTSQDVCMRFYAHMFGKGICHLSVKDTVSGKELFKLKGSQGRRWFDTNITLPASANQNIMIEVETSRRSVIAVDDIAVSPGKCAPMKELFKCNFNNGSCGFKQDDTDECDWKIATTPKGKALQWTTDDCADKRSSDAFLLKELMLPQRGGCLTIDYHLKAGNVCQFYVTLFDASHLNQVKRSHGARRIYYKRSYSKGGKVQQAHVTVPPARRGCGMYELEFATKLSSRGRKRCEQVNIDKLVFTDKICGN
eukprot:gene4747-5371_t